MTMLIEISNVSQPAGEPRRRWFVSDDLDLVVWCDESGRPSGFQLCYDKGLSERALTWQPDRGFTHTAVDDGDRGGGSIKPFRYLLGMKVYFPHAASPIALRPRAPNCLPT
jgi:hypothetical protein